MPRHKRIVLTVLLSVLGVLLVEVFAVLIFVYSGLYNIAASRPHTALGNWFLETTMEESVKRRAGDVEAPQQASAAGGVAHFDSMCVICHGGPGVERSEIGKGVRPEPPALSEEAAEWTVEEIYWIVEHGIKMSAMPAFGPTHEEKDLWAVAYFVKELPDLSATQYQERLKKAGHSESSEQPSGESSGAQGSEQQH